MSNRSPYLWPVVTAALGLLIFFIALPDSAKTWAPDFLRAPSLHLGLDLKPRLEEVPAELARLEQSGASAEILDTLRLQRQTIEQQQENLVEAIRAVLERRINGLGVSEATITPSYIGGEKHLLVECPGVIDVQQCIDTVGKTIRLEFKEEFTEATAEFQAEVRAKADRALARITGSGDSLLTVGQDLGDELPAGLASIWDRAPGAGVVRLEGTIQVPGVSPEGRQVIQDVPGVFLAEVTGPKTSTGRVIDVAHEAFDQLATEDPALTVAKEQVRKLDASVDPLLAAGLRSTTPGQLKVVSLSGSSMLVFVRSFTPGREEVQTSHILVSYSGATAAEPGISRTKEQALERARQLKARLDAGEAFEAVARAESDGPSKAAGGKLDPFTRGGMVPSFEAVAFTAAEGSVSVDKATYRIPDEVSYDALTIPGADSASRGQTFVTRLQNGEVTRMEEALPVRFLYFSLEPTGWKDTPLDGKHFRAAAVTSDPTTGLPVVQISFDDEGAGLFRELTRNNVGKRIAIFVGGQLITAPTVQGEIGNGIAIITGSRTFEEARVLAQDLNTGSIPAPIYLSGQRTVEPTLGDDALKASLYASLVGIAVVMLYLVAVYRLLGLVACAALTIYAVLFLALMKLPLFLVTDQYVVLTLAGIAGMILSIGMSVDTNVLIFERMREELRKGKSFKTAAEVGFDRSWSSIRDSNVSTLITCAILFSIGTSIVRGFAVTLALGVVVSMFTGVTITRWFIRRLTASGLADRLELYGVRRRS